MGKVGGSQPVQLNSLDNLLCIKGSDSQLPQDAQIKTGLLTSYGQDNEITYLLTHIKNDSDVSVVRDQFGHLTWSIGTKQVHLGSSWWDRTVHKLKMTFSSSYEDELADNLKSKIEKVTEAYNNCWLAEVDVEEIKQSSAQEALDQQRAAQEQQRVAQEQQAELIRLAQEAKDQKIADLNTQLNTCEGELADLQETLANKNMDLDAQVAKKSELHVSKDRYLPKETYEAQRVELGKVMEAYKNIIFFINDAEEKIIKAGEDLIGSPLRTAPQRKTTQAELNETIKLIDDLDIEIAAHKQLIDQYGIDVANLTIQLSGKDTVVNQLKEELQTAMIIDIEVETDDHLESAEEVISKPKLFIPLVDDYTSVRTSIKEFTLSNFKDEMSVSQIKILNKQILTAIRKDKDYKDIKAISVTGDLEPLSNKLAEISEKLIVSPKSVWAPEVNLRSDRDYLIYNTIRGHLPCFKQIKKDPALISAVLWDTNLEVLDEARALVQNLLSDMNRQLISPDLSASDEFHLEMIMGDLLALYPFLMPKDGEKIQLPAKIDGVWSLQEYTTDRIEMTPSLLSSPLVAYGLRPSHLSAPPLLIFKGTTYSTDEGALMSFMTDINPFGSVGDYGFRMGRKKIKAWFEGQTSEAKVNVYGKSLGGAQSWRTAINFPDKIGKVMAYGAPGFAPLELHKLGKVTKKYPDLQFNFFCQRNDLVHFSDFVAKEGVNYYEVLSGECQNNALAAHADMYSTQESSMILHMQPEAIQSPGKRAAVTIARLIASLLFPIVGIMVMLNAICRTIAFIGRETVRLIQSIGTSSEEISADVVIPGASTQ